jgi:hypothetical protein
VNVLLISRDFDIGGQGHRIVEAFRRHAPDWVVRSMVKLQTYLAYPTDLPLRRRHLEELYQQADVIHARNSFEHYDQLAAKYGPKPVVYHGHGSKLRGNPEYWIRECRKRNAIALVSTLDLYLLAPDVFEWLPAPYDIDALEAL